MSGPLSLCLNCLQPGAVTIAIGPDKGSQRDPYREQLYLCPTCRDAILEGDFGTMCERYRDERVARRAGTDNT